jgi:hypothetical protein
VLLSSFASSYALVIEVFPVFGQVERIVAQARRIW